METRFVAFFVAFICIFAANNSEGNRKLAERILEDGVSWVVHEIDKDKVEQIWNYCKKELMDDREALLNIGVEFDSISSMKRAIQKVTADLPPSMKETILACLRKNNFPSEILRNEQETLSDEYQKLFSGWANTPRRYLKNIKEKKRVIRALSPADFATPPMHQVPGLFLSPDSSAPAEAPEPSIDSSPADLDSPSRSVKNVSHDSNNDMKYIVAAAVAVSLVGCSLMALLLFLYLKKRERVEAKEGQRDEKPLLNFSASNISVGSTKISHALDNPRIKDLNAPSTAVSGLAQGESQSTESTGKPASLPTASLPTDSLPMDSLPPASLPPASLPLPPGRTAPPPPPGPPPPPPPKPPAPAPPPPPKAGGRPPNPPAPARPSPLGPHHRPSPTGGTSEHADEHEAPKTKLKPFFWDKVLASPNHSMVWHEIKEGSFQFNEEMMERLFGYVPTDKNKNDRKKDSPSLESSTQFIKIIDPKKAQNLAILLRALNVTTEEVSDALKEGHQLLPEFVETLLKMAPTTEEELKLRLYTGDVSLLGPAERFLKVIIGIPFAFKRLESLLFVSTFQEELSSLKVSFATLEVACTELRSSRLFLKLLEAVLKTGNRMNDGTYRGGAQAFKLDTLLKLSDVKGTDGKTTLLHFVVHEIIRSEGVRAARRLRESRSMSSVKTEDLVDDQSQETEEYHRSLGLQVVSDLSNELKNVKKAAAIDSETLSESVFKLGESLRRTKGLIEDELKSLEGESEFHDSLTSFVHQSESDVTWLVEEEKRIMALVKSTGDYFHGKAGRDEGLHLFVIVRDFLVMVDKACKDVKASSKLLTKAPKKEALSSSSSSASPSPSQEPSIPESSIPESSLDIHRRLFPAMREREIDDEDDFSSDDES